MSLTISSGTDSDNGDADNEDSDNEVVEVLTEIRERLAAVLVGLSLSRPSDIAAIAIMTGLESLGRQVDAARVTSAHDLSQRAATDFGPGSLLKKLGCRNTVDLVTTVTRISNREAKRRIALGGETEARVGVGASLPALYPVVGAALGDGTLGVDAAEVIVKGLTLVARQASPGDLQAAEQNLVDTATGAPTVDADGKSCLGFAFPADSLRTLVGAWQARLDPDGIAPQERAREAKSSIGFGALQDGLYRLIGGLTPLDRGIMEKYWAATIASTRPVFVTDDGAPAEGSNGAGLSGGADGDDVPIATVVSVDTRPAGEKRADVLRALFVAAARDSAAATMGGGAPTVVVHVNAADLDAGRGVGWIDGLDAPISLKTVTDVMKISTVEPVVFDRNGTIVQVGSIRNRRRRLFDHLQRRAITARDGGCVVPGCTVPAYYCELNHVVPYSEGGDTLISNGCCVCWWHHTSMGTPGGWNVRMRNGRPQVQAPHWLDPTGTWHAAQKHRASTASTRGA